MHLVKLHITNFKNIEEAQLEFSPNINCFVGNNGEGKTNVMDAIYFLSFCKSAFNHMDAQVLKHEQDFFVLQGAYQDREGNAEEIYCGMQRGKKKHVKRNKKEYRRLSEHLGLVPVILVSPSDASIIEGTSEERRHLMDVTISQYDREYVEALARYGKALQSRNTLLKKACDEGSGHSAMSPDASMISLIELYEEEMAAQGELIYNKRCDFINEITPLFQRYHNKISDNKETVSLQYVSHCQRGPLLEVIQRDRVKDLIMGYSLHGIHRDELEMTIGGYPMKKEGSQGQNKTFVLALKLSQFEYLKAKTNGKTPILLLDDIFDKLDAHRVEQIVNLVSGDDFGQIFITDTNREHLDMILSRSKYDYRMFYVEEGRIECSEHNQNC